MKKNNEKQTKPLIDLKSLIISIIIVALLSIPVIFLLLDNNKKEDNVNKEDNKNVPKGCITCSSESGICCPLAMESSFQSEELSELEVKYGCVKCPNSPTGKCCPVHIKEVPKLKDWCLTCSITGAICCPTTAEELGLTEEELQKGCWVCEEDGTVCCPDE